LNPNSTPNRKNSRKRREKIKKEKRKKERKKVKKEKRKRKKEKRKKTRGFLSYSLRSTHPKDASLPRMNSFQIKEGISFSTNASTSFGSWGDLSVLPFNLGNGNS